MAPVLRLNGSLVFLHPLTDVLLVVIGLRSAFRGGADFLFYLVREVSVLSIILHNKCDFLINSRFGRKSKGKCLLVSKNFVPLR